MATRSSGESEAVEAGPPLMETTAEAAIADDTIDKPRGGVQSIDRASAMLDEIARHRDGITLAELSRAVGLHNSTAFHLLKTMLALGYVRQTRERKRYVIGRSLFTIAANAFDRIEMVNIANPILEDLSRDTGESSHFATRVGDDVAILAKFDREGAIKLADRVGYTRPAHCTAIGKVILASLDTADYDRITRAAPLVPFTSKTITDLGQLRAEIDEVRRNGMAFDDSEFDQELRCVAVPVRSFTGAIVGAIGISGPVWRMTIQMLQGRARIVAAAAERLSAAFGAPVVSDSA